MAKTQLFIDMLEAGREAGLERPAAAIPIQNDSGLPQGLGDAPLADCMAAADPLPAQLLAGIMVGVRRMTRAAHVRPETARFHHIPGRRDRLAARGARAAADEDPAPGCAALQHSAG